jgi:NitT/TauT family transport system permease protein
VAAPLAAEDSRSRQLTTAGGEAARAVRLRRHGLSGPASAAVSVAAVGLALLGWELVFRAHWVASYSLPSPRSVWHEWWALSRRGILWHHVWATVEVALLGFAVAAVIAFVLGYPLAKSRLMASFLSPYVAATQAMPIIALAPLLLVWFGLGLTSKMLICTVIVFFPMLVTTAVGIRTVDQSLVEAAHTEGANWWETLWRVEFPLALRTILAGLRMGLTLSMTGAIVSEFVSASAGLGYLMELGQNQYNSPLLFAASGTMVAIAVLGYVVIGLVEHAVIDWD